MICIDADNHIHVIKDVLLWSAIKLCSNYIGVTTQELLKVYNKLEGNQWDYNLIEYELQSARMHCTINENSTR